MTKKLPNPHEILEIVEITVSRIQETVENHPVIKYSVEAVGEWFREEGGSTL